MNNLVKEEYKEYRQELLREIEEEKNEKKKLLESLGPKKGATIKEEVLLPMPTSDKVLKDKNINLNTYGSMMLESNWGGEFNNPDDRYIYSDKLESAIDQVCKELKISKRTVKNHIKKLVKCGANILEPCTTAKGELYYRLNYKEEDKYYTLIHDKALRKLTNAYHETTLRIYLVLLYKCFESRDKETGEITYKECQLTQEYLCKKIGLSANSRRKIADCMEALAKGGFIKIRLEYTTRFEANDNDVTNYPIPNYYYSISRDYLTKSYIQKTTK